MLKKILGIFTVIICASIFHASAVNYYPVDHEWDCSSYDADMTRCTDGQGKYYIGRGCGDNESSPRIRGYYDMYDPEYIPVEEIDFNSFFPKMGSFTLCGRAKSIYQWNSRMPDIFFDALIIDQRCAYNHSYVGGSDCSTCQNCWSRLSLGSSYPAGICYQNEVNACRSCGTPCNWPVRP